MLAQVATNVGLWSGKLSRVQLGHSALTARGIPGSVRVFYSTSQPNRDGLNDRVPRVPGVPGYPGTEIREGCIVPFSFVKAGKLALAARLPSRKSTAGGARLSAKRTQSLGTCRYPGRYLPGYPTGL
eukprot:1687169-Rhodomonas_salina.3